MRLERLVKPEELEKLEKMDGLELLVETGKTKKLQREDLKRQSIWR